MQASPRKTRRLIAIGYVILLLCSLALVSSILSGSIPRTVIAVGCIHLTLTALDYNRQTLTVNVNQNVVNEAGAADEGGEGD